MDIKAILHQVANSILPGDAEFEKILNAICLAESNGNPNAIGDGGWSIGLFQNHMRDGRGKGHTREQLLDPLYNATLAAKDLVKYYQQGKTKGIKGPQLATYVSKTGQRPAPGNEVHAGENYGRMVGQQAIATNEPQVFQGVNNGTHTINPVNVPKQYGPNDPVTLQRLTDERNKQLAPRAQFEKEYADYQKNPPKPTTIMDIVNFFLSSATPQAYAQEKIPMSSQTNTMAQNYQPQYTVKPNDTLWGIAQQNLGDGNRYKELGYQGNPNTMPVGTKLTIPQQQTSTPVTIPPVSKPYTPRLIA